MVLGENGTIIEQGSYTGLNISEDYVQSLTKGPEPNNTDSTAVAYSNIQGPVRPLPQAATTDSSRQNGDWKVYAYYSKSLGLLGFMAFSLFVALETALFVIQCKSLWQTTLK